MGRIILQMMISIDGMVSGPQGELDWGADNEQLERANSGAQPIYGSIERGSLQNRTCVL